MKIVVSIINTLGLRILRATKGNAVTSPASIALALAQAHEGARGNTATEIEEVLGMGAAQVGLDLKSHVAKIAQDENATVSLASRAFIDPGFVASSHGPAGQGRYTDFTGDPERSRHEINQWASDATQGKIAEVLPAGSVSNLTRLVLANALYFKATWATSFDEAHTRDLPFQGVGNVPTMCETFSHVGHYEDPHLQALQLNYTGRYSMVLILPRGDLLLDEAEEILAANYTSIRNLLLWQKVSVRLPRFKLAPEGIDLCGALGALGMKDAFTDDADFSGFCAEHLKIDGFLHKGIVDVNEEGTEAAAVTAVTFLTRCAAVERVTEFHANRPFLFLIQDRLTDTILFAGRVVQPAG